MLVRNGGRVATRAAQRKIQEAELQVAETKMLSLSLGASRMERIWWGKSPRGRAAHAGDKTRDKQTGRRFGHVERRYTDCIIRRMLRLELAGRRSRGRAERRLMDVVKEDKKWKMTDGGRWLAADSLKGEEKNKIKNIKCDCKFSVEDWEVGGGVQRKHLKPPSNHFLPENHLTT